MKHTPDSGIEPPVAPPGEPAHWLVRPGAVLGLWIGFGLVLAALVLGDLLIHAHPGFGIDGAFGFYAWYGLGACGAMVLFAKGLGVALKRPDTWYDEGRQAAPEETELGTSNREAASAPAMPGADEAAGRDRPGD